MTPHEMVYDSVYKGCLKQGVCEYVAKDAAVMALRKYKNNQFTKVYKLIENEITKAKSVTKRKKK